jgi:eukaryotic-like serine/threonine-protein kinase
MAFELLQGHRPFPGPDTSDFRLQHLGQPSPPLTGTTPPLASLVTECLYKAPQARPTPANILTRLRASQDSPSPAAARLQQANQAIVEKQAQDEALSSAQKSVAEQRGELLDAARQSGQNLAEILIARILEAAPSATVTRGTSIEVRLGGGILIVDPVKAAPANCLATAHGRPPFDVIGYSAIAVRKPRDRYGYEGRSHSLWYCDAQEEYVYRWFETAFMVTPMMPLSSSLEPFALAPTDPLAAGAFSVAITERQVAWGPLPLDQGDEEQFLERWLGWFASAVDGTLQKPNHMPESSGGHHRRS